MYDNITEEQQQFIRDNRLTMSMNDFVRTLGVPYSQVRSFMITNKLQLSNEEISALKGFKAEQWHRKKKLAKNQSKWVPDPWNHGLNLITMQPLKTLTQ